MKMGPLIAFDAERMAVPSAWVRAAVAYTCLADTVLCLTPDAKLRAGAPEVVLKALEAPYRLLTTTLLLLGTTRLAICGLQGAARAVVGVRRAIFELVASKQSADLDV